MNKLTLLLTLLCVLHFFTNLHAQTNGELAVSTVTGSAGGNFSPKNILAIWIEDSNGNFVKTLLAYAQNRRTHLNVWQASTAAAGTEFNVTDAITGATRNSHANRSAMWDARDYTGNVVPDGDYRLWFELTDKNGTGNYGSIVFIKSNEPQVLYPVDLPSFSEINIQWQPENSVGIHDFGENKDFIAFEQNNLRLNVTYPKYFEISVFDLRGQLLVASNQNHIDLSHLSKGIYVVVLTAEESIYANKIMIP
ncbi:MAG: DUF2271 domain-containing protein [Bacteroidales bacterium]|jgi:hypothetical protein|nr:DUF2271 domain-containing protein [Bacteroidales bacterium]